MKQEVSMTPGGEQRVEGVDPADADARTKAVFDAQAAQWGAPLRTHLVYARVPAIYRAVRGMWAGLSEAGLVDERLHALLNRRVAALNGCEF
jgi:hypothetical protein